ncbi:aspartate--tRNA ligase [bacterium CPR1]|nr:aspartate--tRNA ligase [bacterium CPR1]
MQDGTEPLGGLRRTHRCGELRTEHVGQEVVLMGWVHRRRDLGGLIFVEVRDREGLAQCVFDSAESKSAFALAERLRSEYVVAVEGKVLQRSPQTVNPNLATGEVEVHVDRLRLLNPSRELPILVAEEQNVDESKRMQYRYLDLRRPRMTRNIVLRHRFTKAVRDYLDSVGFLEIETPMLVRSTPEGARDYLVPSRVHPGSFYALPQSPQLFKQLLMVSGLDRYFQIARCFRDEDLRADRQPEFTQIDMEMSFVGQEDVFGVVEGLVAHVWSTVMEHQVARPIRRMHYKEAAERYGSDKPDLRFGLELHSLDEIVRGSEFTPFEQTLSSGGTVKALMVPGRGAISRKEQDEVGALVSGLKTFYASRQQGELKSSLLAKLGAERVEKVLQALGAGEGDLVIMAAGPAASLNGQLGRLRLELARRYELIPASKFEFLWVVDFPLFAFDEESGRLVPEHHPFTSPHPEDAHLLDSDPRQVRAAAYDLVLNGNEVASGSIRIHQREMQEKVLGCIGLSIEDARQKFGFLLDAFEYGAPPHGGIALGLDRLVAICVGCDSIREVLAFPKNASAADPMTGAPVEVSQDQLDILHLNVRVPQGAR